MTKENKRKEKLCLFFASDYHFEMISLPYINENLKKNKDVVIMTENDLGNSVNKVISSINLNEEEKNRLNKIDWKNDELNKFKEVKNADKDGKELLIFVKGRENYINNMNKNIENWTNLKNVEIVDCYDINEVQNNAGEIAKQYDNVLFSSGVEKMI